MEDWDEGQWRLGWGFGIGAASMPGTAGGLPLELNLEATEGLTDLWQLRLRGGAFADLMGPSIDYRRDVFVDGKRVGSQLETIDYTRRKDYGPVEPQREEGRWQLLPAVDAALGRYGGGGRRSFWRFEIRYQAILHFPRNMTSFPGDNAEVTHSVTWQWAWF